MIKILIADDHSIVREGLKQVVALEKNLKVTGEAGSSVELFEQLEKQTVDIIILDINMPGRSGLDIMKDLNIRYPHIPVLILSMYSEEQYGFRAIKAGASGYLKKVSAPEELVIAIKKIVAGGKYISPALAENLAKNVSVKSTKLLHENLSNREYEIMCKIASGKSAEGIADELSISINTFYSFRNRILDKMKLKSNVEITQYVLQNKLLD
jgi:two-component system invasion response regulator UvrY